MTNVSWVAYCLTGYLPTSVSHIDIIDQLMYAVIELDVLKLVYIYIYIYIFILQSKTTNSSASINFKTSLNIK